LLTKTIERGVEYDDANVDTKREFLPKDLREDLEGNKPRREP
jgi:hypothetical protein